MEDTKTYLDKLIETLFGGFIIRRCYSLDPNHFALIGREIIEGQRRKGYFPLESRHQYKTFRRVWEDKSGEKLPDYKAVMTFVSLISQQE